MNVADWILSFGCSFLISSFYDLIKNFNINQSLNLETNQIQFIKKDNNQIVNFDRAWFRRDTKINIDKYLEVENISDSTKNRLNKHFSYELESVKKAILKNATNLNWLTEYNSKSIDKYEVLQRALACGLLIPDTLITNSKELLKNFIYKNQSVICKSLHEENLSFNFGDKFIIQYVKEITIDDLDQIPQEFLPSFFQEKINKEFEIRTFYLNKKCYSMAIFDDSAGVDMKMNYSSHRNIPFKLPIDIEEKVCELMGYFNLETGSLDFLKKRGSNDIYFLEINPIGHFGNVSISCNYYLEKEVAKFLCNE